MVVVSLSATLFSKSLVLGSIPSTIDSITGTGESGLVFGNPDSVGIMVSGSTLGDSVDDTVPSLCAPLSGVDDTRGSAKLTLFV